MKIPTVIKNQDLPLARSPRLRSTDRTPPLARYFALLALISLAYLSTLTDANLGWIGDGQVMLDTAVSLHEFGDLTIGYQVDPNSGLIARPGSVGKYGIGYSLVEQVPLFFADSVEHEFRGGFSNLLFALMNMLLTAATALTIALSMRAMEFPFWCGALTAIGYSFGTFAWPYISYDFSEPLQTLCLSAGFWLLVRSVRVPPISRVRLAAAGMVLGLGILTKVSLLLLLPVYAAYLWFGIDTSLRNRAYNLAWFGVPLGMWGVLIAVLNRQHFGSMLEFGYGIESTQFTTPWIQGLWGLLLSPNKGIVFYAPLALLVPGALWGRRSHRREVFFLLCASSLQILLVSKWWAWEGGVSWGPRLLLPIVPLLMICAALLLNSIRWWPALFSACLVAGVGVNLLGVLLNMSLWPIVVALHDVRIPLAISGRPASEYVEHDGVKWFATGVAVNYVPALSPILGHAWLLRMRYFDLPFSLKALDQRPSASLPSVPYGPVKIDLSQLNNQYSLSLLLSPHFWLWDALLSHPRDPLLSIPLVGRSLKRLGSSAALNGDSERAEQCYRHVTTLMTDDVDAVLKLSQLQTVRGAPREAQATLVQFLDRQPNSLRARLRLAQLYDTAGDRASALREYHSYLLLGPDEEHRRQIERRITQMTGGSP